LLLLLFFEEEKSSFQFCEDLGSGAMVDAVVEVHDLLQAGLRRLRLGVDPVVAFVKSEK
jgi:hypothetical protein